MQSLKYSRFRQYSLLVVLTAVIVSLTTVVVPSRADEYRIVLQLDNFRSTCKEIAPSIFTITAGAKADLNVSIRPLGSDQADPPYRGITDWTWPSDLTIEVGTIDTENLFMPSSTLFEALCFRYYLPVFLVENDSLWRNTGYITISEHRFPEYHFLFSVPKDFGNQILWIRVRSNIDGFGKLETIKDIEVYTPCSVADEQAIYESNIYFANKSGNYEQAIDYVDSLITQGWLTKYSLLQANKAALEIKRFDKALQYLDRCFEFYGTVDRHAVPKDSTSERQNYERKRQKLIELQQQQR